jgi:hypothetical protein
MRRDMLVERVEAVRAEHTAARDAAGGGPA